VKLTQADRLLAEGRDIVTRPRELHGARRRAGPKSFPEAIALNAAFSDSASASRRFNVLFSRGSTS
jgi:hypothetical protein